VSSRVYRLRAPRRDHLQQPHDRPQHESEATRHQVRTDESGSMRAIWNCLASKGMYDMKKLCGHWNVYIGWKIPKRIDLRCKKCGTRHQFRPARTSTRGRKSQLHWLAFPDDSLQEELQRYANRRNGSVQPNLPGFQTALDHHLEGPREQIRAHLQKVVSPVGGGNHHRTRLNRN